MMFFLLVYVQLTANFGHNLVISSFLIFQKRHDNFQFKKKSNENIFTGSFSQGMNHI